VPPDPNQADFFMMRDPNKLVLSNIPQLSQHTVSYKKNHFAVSFFKEKKL